VKITAASVFKALLGECRNFARIIQKVYKNQFVFREKLRKQEIFTPFQRGLRGLILSYRLYFTR
jgi:hypothetical protein